MKNLILFFLISLSLYSKEVNEISVTIEVDKTKDISCIPVKFSIKNISKSKLMNVGNLELYRISIVDGKQDGIGIAHMQTTFDPDLADEKIKPGKTFSKVIELKDFFSDNEKWQRFKDSKQDFSISCSVFYLDRPYKCNDLKLKIN